MKFTSLAQRELNQVSRFNSRGIRDTHLRSQAHARAYMIVISQGVQQKINSSLKPLWNSEPTLIHPNSYKIFSDRLTKISNGILSII